MEPLVGSRREGARSGAGPCAQIGLRGILGTSCKVRDALTPREPEGTRTPVNGFAGRFNALSQVRRGGGGTTDTGEDQGKCPRRETGRCLVAGGTGGRDLEPGQRRTVSALLYLSAQEIVEVPQNHAVHVSVLTVREPMPHLAPADLFPVGQELHRQSSLLIGGVVEQAHRIVRG